MLSDQKDPILFFEDLGLIDYEQALQKQLDYVEKVSSDQDHPGFLIFCTHPAVVTTGRQTRAEDIFAWNGKTIEISRGGRATYHGPSQLVVYPILNLKHSRKDRGPQEVRGYLRALENGIVETLKKFDVYAVGKTPQKKTDADAVTEETGVWVENQKIASLGIAVKKWVTYHGAAINLDYDPEAFFGLNPCGFQSKTMVCLESLIGKSINRSHFSELLRTELIQVL